MVTVLHKITSSPFCPSTLSQCLHSVIMVVIIEQSKYYILASSHKTVISAVSPVCNAVVLLQHTVVFGDGLGEVCHQGDFHGTQTSLLPWCVDPEG